MHNPIEKPGQIGDFWLSQRRGSSQWCRTWYDGKTRQTRRASLGAADFQEAKILLFEWFSKHGQLTDQDPANTPAETIFARYYQQHAAALPSAEMARIALAYWSDFFAAKTVNEVTIQEQRRFVKWVAGHQPKKKADGYEARTVPPSDGYIKRILTVGKAAFAWAVREGELRSAPHILTWQDAPARERVLTVEESRALWQAAKKPHERMFLALAFGLLARPEAILELRREYADLDRQIIAQNPPGRKQTRKYRPTVPIPAFLQPMLKDAPDGPLVQWKGQPIDSFKTAFRRMRRDAGLGQDVVAKTIRHTVATYLRSRGVPEAEIQGYLGHKAFSGKTEVYAKYRPEFLGAARVAVDEYWALMQKSPENPG